MERITHMHLKKALFTIAFINLSLALVLSAAAFLLCGRLSISAAPQESITIQDPSAEITTNTPPKGSAQEQITTNLFSTLQFLLPVLIFTAALLATASFFYRLKLQKPLTTLMQGAEHIIKNNLDFTVQSETADEFGQLCTAFETMRQSLLKNNRELWKQAEERKRLNAAFSHELRNPLTVLKGSVKMARQCAGKQNTQTATLFEHLNRMETYVSRIERYVETMSSVQRLEQIQIKKKTLRYDTLAEELKQALHFIEKDCSRQLTFSCMEPVTETPAKTILLDTQLLFQIAENLVSNALRFAQKTVSVHLSCSGGLLLLEVTDDGSGFPEKLLKNGIQPFGKCCEDTEHFGMGLYICSLLCQKHGGHLRIQNVPGGASACAVFCVS
ncbi:MAG: HAMP domain-containing histidine kinase [Lachnospiraceae bacterium]|nr:HAMP domain-containing histidine kinase [Lachnospiraceae bacterium]